MLGAEEQEMVAELALLLAAVLQADEELRPRAELVAT